MTTSDFYSPSRETTEGRVYTVTGGDWDTVARHLDAIPPLEREAVSCEEAGARQSVCGPRPDPEAMSSRCG